MSESYVHINRPSSTRFIARVRRVGCRKYKLVSKPLRDYPAAVRAMARVFSTGDYKRGDVIMVADYYEPTVLCKMVKR